MNPLILVSLTLIAGLFFYVFFSIFGILGRFRNYRAQGILVLRNDR